MTRANANAVFVLDDSQLTLKALKQGLADHLSVLFASGPMCNTLTGWYDFLLAMCETVNGHQVFLSQDRNKIDALGLNAHLCLDGVRRQNAGVALLELLRHQMRSSIPVVLWSFLPLEQLHEENPILQEFDQGFVFLHLPATLSDFRRSFEQALCRGLNFSGPDIVAGNEKNSLQALDVLVSRELVGLINEVQNHYEAISEALKGAVSAIQGGEGGKLIALLKKPDWKELVRATREMVKLIAQAQISVPEVSGLNRQANNLNSYQEWLTRFGIDSSLADAAIYYVNRATLLEKNLERLREWAGNCSADKGKAI